MVTHVAAFDWNARTLVGARDCLVGYERVEGLEAQPLASNSCCACPLSLAIEQRQMQADREAQRCSGSGRPSRQQSAHAERRDHGLGELRDEA